VEFLQELRKRVPASRTVLVAHSMGNQLLLKAVQNLAIQPGERYRAIVMLAPDVGVSRLQASLPALSADAKRSVLYINKEDKALWVSDKKNKEERAGRVDLLDPNGYMETVDITRATHDAGWMHHADHLETTALYDLFWNVVRDQPAECREERGISVKKGGMWEILPSDTTYDVEALQPQCRLKNPQQGH
jgi:esterase/lipase superfamily enzyme